MRQPLPALMTQRARRRRRAGCIPCARVAALGVQELADKIKYGALAHSVVD